MTPELNQRVIWRKKLYVVYALGNTSGRGKYIDLALSSNHSDMGTCSLEYFMKSFIFNSKDETWYLISEIIG